MMASRSEGRGDHFLGLGSSDEQRHRKRRYTNPATCTSSMLSEEFRAHDQQNSRRGK
jgi:hypothetical protein